MIVIASDILINFSSGIDTFFIYLPDQAPKRVKLDEYYKTHRTVFSALELYKGNSSNFLSFTWSGSNRASGAYMTKFLFGISLNGSWKSGSEWKFLIGEKRMPLDNPIWRMKLRDKIKRVRNVRFNLCEGIKYSRIKTISNAQTFTPQNWGRNRERVIIIPSSFQSPNTFDDHYPS